MSAIYAAYTQEVYANLRPLHATWEPTQPVKLGDIGILDDHAFRQQTNLKNLGINFSERRGKARPSICFNSKGTANLQLKPEIRAASGVISQQALLEVSFKQEGATFFHLARCESLSIEDKEALRQQVLDYRRRRNWDLKWAVVTEVVVAGATTIAVAGRSGANIQLEAKGALPTTDLADGSLTFQLRSVKGVGYQLVSEAGLTPLIGLSKVQRRWLKKPDFEPAMAEPRQESEDWDFAEID